MSKNSLDKNLSPLADRLRPQNLEEFVGQEHLVSQGKILRQLIEKDEIPSTIFWGPPGSGKTTLAKIIAQQTGADFVQFSAAESGVGEIKKILEKGKTGSSRPIIFVDEIHRFNKAQQAIFLSPVEKGEIILIGATTENPSFEIISPLLSRCRVFILNPLSPQHIANIIKHALTDKKRGLGKFKIKIDRRALNLLIQMSNGDARIPLNALEIALKIVKPDAEKIYPVRSPISSGTSHESDSSDKSELTSNGVYHLSLGIIKEALQHKTLLYDKKGDEHYQVISAFIKSLRGSDPDAALYWLARMIEAGEDPRFIARRMVIFASEDIGNADPQALVVAVAAAQAVEFVGLPEAQINLAQATTYLACASKSNASYKALLKAKEDVHQTLNLPVPLHLRNAPTQLMKKMGYGKDYLYPHNFSGVKIHPAYPGGIKQEYLPASLRGKKYYYPENLLKKNKK